MNLGRTLVTLVVPLLFVGVASQLPACLDELQVQSGADAGDDGGGCGHATPPLPPNVADDPSKDVTFVTAMRSIRLPTGLEGDALGLDLDRYCTCQGETPSCIPPATQDSQLQCDAPEGRDNGSFAYFKILSFALLAAETSDLQEACTEFANQGRWSVLLRVSGYNGLPDDPKVRVDWLPSNGMASPPQWTGDDIWPVAVGAMEPDGGPRYYDLDAYITKGQLVFALPEANLQMGNGTMRLDVRFTSGTATATIEQDATGRYGLRNGVVAGRIPMEDMFRMVTGFRDYNGAPFCANQGNPYFLATRDAFCRGVDIQTGSPQPNKPCNAISIGLGFEAESIGGVGMVEGPPDAQALDCPPGEDPYSAYIDAGCPGQP